MSLCKQIWNTYEEKIDGGTPDIRINQNEEI